jgi:hypothetical protein
MATKKKAEEWFAPERRHATLTPAKAVRIAREFQEMTQTELTTNVSSRRSRTRRLAADRPMLPLHAIRGASLGRRSARGVL